MIEQKPKYCHQKNETHIKKTQLHTTTLAFLGMDYVNDTYSDPYIDTLQENSWIILILILLLSLCIIFGMLLGTIHQK